MQQKLLIVLLLFDITLNDFERDLSSRETRKFRGKASKFLIHKAKQKHLKVPDYSKRYRVRIGGKASYAKGRTNRLPKFNIYEVEK